MQMNASLEHLKNDIYRDDLGKLITVSTQMQYDPLDDDAKLALSCNAASALVACTAQGTDDGDDVLCEGLEMLKQLVVECLG